MVSVVLTRLLVVDPVVLSWVTLRIVEARTESPFDI